MQKTSPGVYTGEPAARKGDDLDLVFSIACDTQAPFSLAKALSPTAIPENKYLPLR